MLNSFLKALSLVFLFSESAHAFILIPYGNYNLVGARPVSKAPVWSSRSVTFYVNTDLTAYGGSLSATITGAQFLAAFTAAANTWNNLCQANITVVTGGTTTSVRATEGVNTVSYDNRTTAEGNDFGNNSTGAHAVPSITTNDIWTDCDIQVNGQLSDPFGTSGASTDLDLQYVFTHELGHCLGLDHTWGTNYNGATYTTTNTTLLKSVMKGSASLGDITQRNLSQDDIDGIQCVYPSTSSLRSGTFCSSYHGTNGNGTISGTVSGGPNSTRACGNGEYSEIKSSSQKGAGCVTSAVASENNDGPKTYDISLLLLFFTPSLFWVSRKIKKLL